MENSIRLESTINIYDVEFNEVQYEVQITDNEISAIFRADGEYLDGIERENLREFVYKNK